MRDRYSAVGRAPEGSYGFRVGREFAEALGYPADLLDRLPPSTVEAFTGVAAPSVVAPVKPGQTVVDLGSGAGLDLAVLVRKVGKTGRAIGVDFAPEMVLRARAGLSQPGDDVQVEVLEAPAENTGLPNDIADWVTINGLLNLAPDKEAVLREVVRLLRPGGHLLLAETTLRDDLPAGAVSTIDDWFR